MMAASSLVSWTGWGASLVAACIVLTMLALFAWLRGLPADLTLRAMPKSAAQFAIAPPPPGIARLRVALLPETLSWTRLDVFLDGVRVGQLRPAPRSSVDATRRTRADDTGVAASARHR